MIDSGEELVAELFHVNSCVLFKFLGVKYSYSLARARGWFVHVRVFAIMFHNFVTLF